MRATPIRVLPSPAAIGDALAADLLGRMERARRTNMPFLLGCPTGRTPRPVYNAVARRLAARPRDLSHVVLVMMDEYLLPGPAGDLASAPPHEPWSCHHYARTELVDPWNAGVPAAYRIPDTSVWFPDPRAPAAYDRRIADAGRIDLFLLASGASDGHVAFNPPGSPRASQTRVVALSEATRRDNLQTFPVFGTLAAVPHHGVGVGIDTIVSARAAVMVVWGAGKRRTLARMRATTRYTPDWPATVIHECAGGAIVCDAAAAAGDADPAAVSAM